MINNYLPKEEQDELAFRLPNLKVIGLGGGGSNAVDRMIQLGITGVEFIAANTDAQVLRSNLAPTRIQLGPEVTRGLGAGGNPSIGEAAALESEEELRQALQGADMVFLTAGMGGGTGTGSIPVAARIAKEIGAVTVAIVTLPFTFEMGKRAKNAREGLEKLRQFSDTLITVPNDKLLNSKSANLPLDVAFRLADDLLRQGVQGISELVTQPGLINVDFAHIRNLFQSGGGSILTIGYGKGMHKAKEAIQQALSHPLLDDIPLKEATGIIANFTGGKDLTFIEVAEALSALHEETATDTDIIPGVLNNDLLHNRVQVILIITGLGGHPVSQESVETRREIHEAQPISITPAVSAVSAYAESASHTGPQLRDHKHMQTALYPPVVDNTLDIPAYLRKYHQK